MATIRERKDAQGNKSYDVQIRLRGFPPQTRTFNSKTLAKQWAAQVETDLRAGRYLQRIEAERHTVHEMIDRYRREVLLTRKPQRGQIKAGFSTGGHPASASTALPS